MTVTNSESGTNVHEIAEDIFRISTPVPPSVMPGGFTFNQVLVRDAAPLLFHTGPRRLFEATRAAIEKVLASGLRTPDMGGTASTTEMGKAIADAV